MNTYNSEQWFPIHDVHSILLTNDHCPNRNSMCDVGRHPLYNAVHIVYNTPIPSGGASFSVVGANRSMYTNWMACITSHEGGLLLHPQRVQYKLYDIYQKPCIMYVPFSA